MSQRGPWLTAIQEHLRPFYLKWLYFQLYPERRPEAWRAAWRVPAVPPEPSGPLPDVLILPLVDWHSRIQRPQHLAGELAALGHRVFYLNPNLGRQFDHPVVVGPASALRRLDERIYEVHAGMPSEPVFHHRMLTAREERSLATGISQLLKDAGCVRLAVLCQFPLYTGVAQSLRCEFGGVIIGDCHDRLGGFERMAADIVRAEPALFRTADAMIFSAQALLDEAVKDVPEVQGKGMILRNGVNVGDFRLANGAGTDVVGYVGALDHWFDIDGVEAAAKALPRVRFVLVGRIEDAKIGRLRALPNVELRGEMPYAAVPGVLSTFQVGLIPFLVTPLTMATNPIKLYEYLAAGLPIAASHLPELHPFAPWVEFYAKPDSLAGAIQLALARRSPADSAARRVVASGESWKARGKALHDLILRTIGT